MKFTSQTIALLVLPMVATTSAYQCGPRFTRFGTNAPLVRSARPFASALQRQEAMINSAFQQQSAIERAFERAYETKQDLRRSTQEARGTVTPRYEITNTDDAVSVSMDVPGVDPSNIDVSLEENVLTLSGTRETATSNYKFSRSFSLDEAVDVNQLSANLENGVLVVSAPKMEKVEVKPKKIPINVVATSSKEELDVDSAKADATAAVEEDTIEMPESAGDGEETINLDTTASAEVKEDRTVDEDSSTAGDI